MIRYIDEVEIKNKKVMLRVDVNVPFNNERVITDDTRIQQILPTIHYLLKNSNKIILVSYLGKPKVRDPKYSLNIVVKRLRELLPEQKIILIDDFLTAERTVFEKQKSNEILVLENIRFYSEEKQNNAEFAKKLSILADVFVNDAFGQSHRLQTSIVGVPSYVPSYGGFLMKKEVKGILGALESPIRPVVAIIAGAKISSKIGLIEKLMTIADSVLIGGAMTNNFLKAKGMEIGKGLVEVDFVPEAKRLLDFATAENKKIILPVDRRIGVQVDETSEPTIKKVEDVRVEDETLDIGPETEKLFSGIISEAKTILWNGPVGYFENPQFAKGSIAIYNAIVSNSSAVSVLGGGDTLSVIKKLPNKDKITHISTGGGAMLELIEKGTLPGLEALDK